MPSCGVESQCSRSFSPSKYQTSIPFRSLSLESSSGLPCPPQLPQVEFEITFQATFGCVEQSLAAQNLNLGMLVLALNETHGGWG